jgi:hypothetical protein
MARGGLDKALAATELSQPSPQQFHNRSSMTIAKATSSAVKGLLSPEDLNLTIWDVVAHRDNTGLSSSMNATDCDAPGLGVSLFGRYGNVPGIVCFQSCRLVAPVHWHWDWVDRRAKMAAL